jgi:CTP-dependent riboflavin kinase
MADGPLTIHGVLRDGLRVAAQFTELPWVREQFQRKLGLDVHPGTVNLQVEDPAGLAALARLRAAGATPDRALRAVPIDPPEGGAYCVGWCFAAHVGALPAAIVVPDIVDYPPDKLELIAAVHLRDALGLAPGDRVVVTLDPAAPDEPAADGGRRQEADR